MNYTFNENNSLPGTELIQSLAIESSVKVDVLRLDKIHPIVSGNKWFKLKYYLADAHHNNAKQIVTCGGAHSNHIVATAFACKKADLKSVGIIRGEEPNQLSHTLIAAKEYGMQLIFESRTNYADKTLLRNKYLHTNDYWINEGGFGIEGASGASEILSFDTAPSYTHILCACGTGTTIAGLIKAAHSNQKVIGINVLKGYESLSADVEQLLSTTDKLKDYSFFNNYHFGGYAKHPDELIRYMNHLWKAYQLPTDIVYTSKLFYAVFDLIQQTYFPPLSKLLVIHSGGLQGNQSLEKNRLHF